MPTMTAAMRTPGGRGVAGVRKKPFVAISPIFAKNLEDHGGNLEECEDSGDNTRP